MSQIFENKLKELGIVLNDDQKRQFDFFMNSWWNGIRS